MLSSGGPDLRAGQSKGRKRKRKKGEEKREKRAQFG